MTFQTLQDRLNDRIAGWGNLTFPDTRKKRYLNDGYTEFARLTHILWKQSTVTVAINDALYAFPTVTGVESALKVWRATWDDKVLIVRSTRYMDTYYGTGWRDDTGTEFIYILTDSEDRSQIRVYPMISDADDLTGKSLIIEYSYIPSDMSAPSDVCALGEIYSLSAVEFAVHACLEDPTQSKQNPMMGDRAFQNFWRLVGSARQEVHRGLFHDYNTHVTPPVR